MLSHLKQRLSKAVEFARSITELPNALHACVEMAREAEANRLSERASGGPAVYEANAKIAELERALALATSEANDLARAAEEARRVSSGLKAELDREREARRIRKFPAEQPPGCTVIMCRMSGFIERGWRVGESIFIGEYEWRFLSPEDMP